tara:strand:+ start:1254 stop:2081 length:828 start_codon:yes stop_codon:yes gene_type:complete
MSNLEVGQFIETCGYRTNYHDAGDGPVVIMLHGSGAGVSGWANWRGIMPLLAEDFRVIVPDLVGFGFTETPSNFQFEFMTSWMDQVVALMDHLGVKSAHLVGNSFGGSLSMWMAARHPQRCERMVLMGPGGWPAPVNENLAELWSYKPSVENMKSLMDIMAFDRTLVTDELAELRYQATIRPGAQETFERVFPAPLQRWLDAQVLPMEDLLSLENETLIIHGRDDIVVDPSISFNLHQHIKNSQLHMFGNCGHWTQIEHAGRFQALVKSFLMESV